MANTQKKDLNLPKGVTKTPDDLKAKKVVAAVDDKKGAKKGPAIPTAKGKKGKDDKEDAEEVSLNFNSN